MSQDISPSTIKIRHFTKKDIAGYYEVLSQIMWERKYLTVVDPYPYEQVKRFVEDMIDRGMPQLVLADGDEVVGWCDVCLGTDLGYMHTGRIGMGLLPKYRHTGWGRKIMQKALDISRDMGIHRIDLVVYGSNKRARKLYENMGFKLEGRQHKARFIDGRYDDILTYAKFFEENAPLKPAKSSVLLEKTT